MLPAGIHSFDLSQVSPTAGTNTLYVKAVGKASFRNKMSAAIVLQVGVDHRVCSFDFLS